MLSKLGLTRRGVAVLVAAVAAAFALGILGGVFIADGNAGGTPHPHPTATHTNTPSPSDPPPTTEPTEPSEPSSEPTLEPTSAPSDPWPTNGGGDGGATPGA